MQRAGFLVQDTPAVEGDGDAADEWLGYGQKTASATAAAERRRRFLDPDDEEDEFDRSFYLSEEP